MDYEEAKKLLHIYKANRNALEEEEGLFREALRVKQENVELAAWFDKEQAFDRAFAQKLRSLPAPADLKAKILSQAPGAARRATARCSDAVPPVEAPSNTIWWRQPWAWTAAACFLFLLAAGAIFNYYGRQETDLARYMAAVIDHSCKCPGVEYKNEDLTAIKTFLARRRVPVPASMPRNLKILPGIGCLSWEYQGRTVGVICFKGDTVYHLYVADRSQFPQFKETGDPVLRQIGEHGGAAWMDDSRVYVLTAKTGAAQLRNQLL